MRTLKDDCAKRRLTEREQIARAVDYLKKQGVEDEDIAIVLSRHFYVDIDELNAVLALTNLRDKAKAMSGRPPASKKHLRAVA